MEKKKNKRWIWSNHELHRIRIKIVNNRNVQVMYVMSRQTYKSCILFNDAMRRCFVEQWVTRQLWNIITVKLRVHCLAGPRILRNNNHDQLIFGIISLPAAEINWAWTSGKKPLLWCRSRRHNYRELMVDGFYLPDCVYL